MPNRVPTLPAVRRVVWTYAIEVMFERGWNQGNYNLKELTLEVVNRIMVQPLPFHPIPSMPEVVADSRWFDEEAERYVRTHVRQLFHQHSRIDPRQPATIPEDIFFRLDSTGHYYLPHPPIPTKPSSSTKPGKRSSKKRTAFHSSTKEELPEFSLPDFGDTTQLPLHERLLIPVVVVVGWLFSMPVPFRLVVVLVILWMFVQVF